MAHKAHEFHIDLSDEDAPFVKVNEGELEFAGKIMPCICVRECILRSSRTLTQGEDLLSFKSASVFGDASDSWQQMFDEIYLLLLVDEEHSLEENSSKEIRSRNGSAGGNSKGRG